MPARLDDELVSVAADAAIALADTPIAYDPLLERIGDARLVLIGEASHGTHEFYFHRAELTKRLIVEKNFGAVAAEADWPDAYRVNHYVRGRGSDRTAEEALGGFKRFPTWMWRNSDVVEFVEWLRDRNRRTGSGAQCGFYGLDLYSLFTSIEAVVAYLEKVDPDAARRARERYSCFEHFGDDTQAYGYAATRGIIDSCEDDVVAQLTDLRRRAIEYASRDGRVAEDEYFYAEQNARLASNAERYYRAMFRGRNASWNLRDTHMVDTLAALVRHLDSRDGRSKIVVWAHNSHLGDARATEMGKRGEVNLGQLARERWRGETVSIGFTTYDGSVTAAEDWDSPAERKRVRPGLTGSIEDILHRTGIGRFILRFDDPELAGYGQVPLLERAIGVIYRPETERVSHYFHARVGAQFDALIHIDRTAALEPLEQWAPEHDEEAPETYPSAL
jgi:erythromycin esterase-like protein